MTRKTDTTGTHPLKDSIYKTNSTSPTCHKTLTTACLHKDHVEYCEKHNDVHDPKRECAACHDEEVREELAKRKANKDTNVITNNKKGPTEVNTGKK